MRQAVKIVLINVVVVLLLLFLVEGMVSYFTIGHAFFTQKIAERQHTQYDEELGWVNVPNVHIPDMYSREDPLTINSQGYRGRHDFSPTVPEGKIRIICSGDSFTLGYGVDDDHTWCHQLTLLDDRLETVNMGQGGYGVDQAYLWYMRDRESLEHDILLFAFIQGDFMRMGSDTFMGYGKPYLSVRDGELVQDNYPVPRRAYDASWLVANLHMWQDLATSQWLLRTFGEAPPVEGAAAFVDYGHTDEVVAKIFSSLQETSEKHQRPLILVYLPTQADILERGYNRWEWLVRAEASTHGYRLINVADAMRSLPPGEVEAMYRSGGHYTDEGNRFVAEVLYRALSGLPQLSKSDPRAPRDRDQAP